MLPIPARLQRGHVAPALVILIACSDARVGGEQARQRSTETATCVSEAAALELVLTDFLTAENIPGGIFGLRLADGRSAAVPAGFSDLESGRQMQADDLLHAGSAGKTFFAALILSLSAEGKIGLDDKIERYLGQEDWFERLPNAKGITMRMLLQHASGIGPYGESFMASLVREPAQRHDPREGLASVLDTPAQFPPGEGFVYSDVNYVLLAYAAERVSGHSAYAEIERRFLVPLHLTLVQSADRRSIAGLVQGYAGAKNPFGGERMLADGELVFDPSFEWGGGGFVTNPRDLARWMADFCEGRAFDARLLPGVFDGRPAPDLGPDTRYGLGVHIDATRFGRAIGHGGFFPGYTTFVRWYEEPRITLAIQLNTSDERKLNVPLEEILDRGVQSLLDLRGH